MIRLPALDAARGLAALCVLAFHYSTAMHAIDPWWPVLDFGGIGVRAFFIISGYVIIGSALRAPSRGAFAWARFVRLAPAYYTCMVLTTLWLAALHFTAYQVSPVDWALNLTMVPGLLGAEPVDGVYWTLAYELGFYATVCAVLPWLHRGRVLWLCAASLPVLWFLPLVGWFLIGVVAHEIERHGVFHFWGSVYDGRQRGRHWSLFSALCRPVATHWRGAASWCGAVSYPLYLIHCKVGVSLILILSPLGPLTAALIATGAMLALATLVHRLIERPAQAALKRWSSRGFPLAQPIVIPEMF